MNTKSELEYRVNHLAKCVKGRKKQCENSLLYTNAAKLDKAQQELDGYIPSNDKWTPKGGDWLIFNDGTFGCVPSNHTVNNDLLLVGKYRPTGVLAERSTNDLLTYQRMLAYREMDLIQDILGH